MEKQISSYDQQAKEFAEKNNLTIRITPYPADMQTAPPWVSDGNSGSRQFPHGIRYRITISHVGKPGRLAFDFWDSIANREKLEKAEIMLNQADHERREATLTKAKGNDIPRGGYAAVQAMKEARPSAYDVLACISSDSYCSDTFSEWCADFGYDTDSRKSLATFKRCRRLAKKINSFFNADELAALWEIQ